MPKTSTWIASPGRPLQGAVHVPGDKSISHRAIMLAAVADGVSRIDGFLDSDDTQATIAIFRQMQVRIATPSATTCIVHGVGLFGLQPPASCLDCKNAGTAMRLLAGLLAGQRFHSTLVGDRSLSRRPMRRVTVPLRQMGAQIMTAEEGTAPLRIVGNRRLVGINYRCDIASAQVKSAVLLAGLFAQGRTCVSEPRPTRDYTERMLIACGAAVEVSAHHSAVYGRVALRAIDHHVPGDFSSAAFFIVAASIIRGSRLTLQAVGLHPRRTGLLKALHRMGARIDIRNERPFGGGCVGDIHVDAARLHGITLPQELVADMIDELPIFMIAAAAASGSTHITGAKELRVKETDRLAAMVTGLRQLGIAVEERADGASIQGGSFGGATVDSAGDHRIAMAFAVAGQIAQGPVRIRDVANVATSFPGFGAYAVALGCALSDPN